MAPATQGLAALFACPDITHAVLHDTVPLSSRGHAVLGIRHACLYMFGHKPFLPTKLSLFVPVTATAARHPPVQATTVWPAQDVISSGHTSSRNALLLHYF